MEKIPGDEGSSVELDNVIFIADGDSYSVGRPNVEGAKVKATILNQGKQRKVIVFKYKNKVRYRRKTGHRQQFTKLAIEEIKLN